MHSEIIELAIEIVGSQRKLARACGVSQPTVWCWLHGKKKVSPQNVNALVKATSGMIKAHQVRPDLPELFSNSNANSCSDSSQ